MLSFSSNRPIVRSIDRPTDRPTDRRGCIFVVVEVRYVMYFIACGIICLRFIYIIPCILCAVWIERV